MNLLGGWGISRTTWPEKGRHNYSTIFEERRKAPQRMLRRILKQKMGFWNEGNLIRMDRLKWYPSGFQ